MLFLKLKKYGICIVLVSFVIQSKQKRQMKKLFILFSIAVTFIFACSKKDKCEDVKCLNGGTCIDGSCACSNGYTGDRCQNVPSAKTMRIPDYMCIDFPSLKSNGSTWDNSLTGTPDPDIFIRVYAGTKLIFESKRFDNVKKSELPLWINDSSPIITPYFSTPITIEMWDYDSLQDNELMGYATFVPNDYKDSRPKIITIGTNGKAMFEVYPIWD